ncbi:MAG: methyltransferase [Luteolibacter sp.]|uniref:methyltransferase n=1 Tax=Luteolibacter sp. TaxID=1962973 RepID=UPI0032667AEB
MTDWESRYQTGDTPWEKGQAAPPLLELLGKLGADAWGDGPVLVPGCGLGHDVRALAALEIPVVGVDLSPFAMEHARQFPPAGKETYELGNFLNPEWRVDRKFSAIWEHTCFCAIDPTERDSYAEAAAGCLTDGGFLAGVFFLTPFDPGGEVPGPPFGATIEEIDARFSPWFERIDAWVPCAAYPGREGKEWIALFRKVAKA